MPKVKAAKGDRVRVPNGPRNVSSYETGKVEKVEKGTQPDECTPEVYWEVSWKSKLYEDVVHHVRRSQEAAYELAKMQRENGFETKLARVERTEVDF